MADVLVGYIASERLLMEGDLVTAAFDWQRCAAEVSKGNYHPGCPIQSKYY